jgi:Ca-activated chloride channel homolog
MADLSNFHLLRPAWLWAVVPAVTLWVLMLLEYRRTYKWRTAIAPHLLQHLVRHPKRRPWVRPTVVALPCLLLEAFTLSGPAWVRQRTPFVEDEAPLVIALDLSESMNAIDVQPTRVERGEQKIRDLLALRRGARTGLIAYAGTSHIVLPLTDDASVIEMYLLSLEPGLMPVAGKNPVKALELAEAMLAGETAPGTILFVTDGIGEQHAQAFAAHRDASKHQVTVLALGTTKGGPVRAGKREFLKDARGQRVTSALDRRGLEAVERRAGAFVVGATVDDRDVQKLARRISMHLESVRAADQRAPWEDYGYYLCFLILPISLVWFRKGWTVRWQ